MSPSDILNANMLADINISFTSTMYALFSSIIAASLLRKAYIIYGRSMNNREYFGNIFILLAVTTCTVIIIVKYSLALSLGLVGALSIVRFRAAIKEPEELVYLFLTIAFGLAFGASQFAVGFSLLVVALGVIGVSSRVFEKNKLATHTGMLCIISGDRNLVSDFKNNQLQGMLESARSAVLKEYLMDGDTGRIVVKLSSGDQGENLVADIEEAVNTRGLNFHIVSEISVPA
jgi:hypothetical protein